MSVCPCCGDVVEEFGKTLLLKGFSLLMFTPFFTTLPSSFATSNPFITSKLCSRAKLHNLQIFSLVTVENFLKASLLMMVRSEPVSTTPCNNTHCTDTSAYLTSFVFHGKPRNLLIPIRIWTQVCHGVIMWIHRGHLVCLSWQRAVAFSLTTMRLAIL